MFDVNDLTAYIIEKYSTEFKPLSNLRLQKVLYFCQGIMSDFLGKSFLNTKFLAWKFGPVVPEIYYLYRDIYPYSIRVVRKGDSKNIESTEIKEHIDSILDKLDNFGDFELVDMTHSHNVWKKNYEPYHNNEMPISEIMLEFSRRG